VLVVGGGLLLDSLRALRDMRLGIDPEGVIEATLDPGTQHYDSARADGLYRDVRSAAGSLPDVAAAGLARWPVLGMARSGGAVRPEGTDPKDPRAINVWFNVVSPGLFAAVGLPLVQGRDFQAEETDPMPGRPSVAILSASAAARLFPDGHVLGRRVILGSTAPRVAEVVGVVADARLLSVKEGEGSGLFEPMGQRPMQWATLYVRGRRGTPSSRELDAAVARIDPSIPLYDVQPLTRRVDQSLGLERLLARVTGWFAALALLLAGVGIYAVMSTVVHGRTRELGVRLALGADQDGVRSMVLWEGLRVALIGIAIGALAATQMGGLISKRLWGVQPLDPTVFLASAGTLLVAAALASWGPAVRATRVDPVRALRVE
jgi:predicted permease